VLAIGLAALMRCLASLPRPIVVAHSSLSAPIYFLTALVFNNSNGYLYSGGVYTPISFPGAATTAAQGINNLGQIVGNYHLNDPTVYPGTTRYNFMYDTSTGVYTTPPFIDFFSIGINDSDQIVGNDGVESFLYSNGVLTLLTLNGMNICCASAINDAGAIVGYYQYSLAPLPATLPLFATGLVGLVLLLAQEEEGIINGHIIFDIVSALVSVASQANPVLSAWYRTGSLPPEHKLPKVADRNSGL
jgi:hypothetical protein